MSSSRWRMRCVPGNDIELTGPVADAHGHYVFGVDDGAVDLHMSLELIKMAYDQGVRDIMCTSHDIANVLAYRRNLMQLRLAVKNAGLEVNLHSGNEIFCEEVYLSEIIERLENGEVLPMGTSNYVLLEFAPWATGEEIIACVSRMRCDTQYEPIIAHIERYRWVHDDEDLLAAIREMKTPVQINAYSLVEESDPDVRAFARRLVAEQLVTFVGSDAHRTDHRPVNMVSGVDYIYKSCDEEYARDICYRNAEKMLF